ncbi:MAG: alkyl hydroperoxide reductase, partial [Verrucomicrobiota bacterium]
MLHRRAAWVLGWLVALAGGRGWGADAGPGRPDDAPAVVPGHSYHGKAFNEGPRQRARLMDGMPPIQFPLTTTNASARAFFLQGVGQLHGFWYLEAERSFRESAFHDTNCALAYWGMAMANLQNAKRAADFIAEAERRQTNVTRWEKLWIGALADFHRDPKREEKERRRDYTRALENLVFEFPEAVEARAFLAFHIWDSQHRGWPISSAQAVESLLKEIFAADPMHPAHHYRIHLWDGEKDASAVRALPSAARSGQSSPGIAHQWHMAGHTFNKLKRYPDMAWQQEASVRVDNAQLMADRLMPDQIHNYAHNSEWLVQTYNYVGRANDALGLALNMIEMPRHPKFNTLDVQTNGLPYPEMDGTAIQGRRRLVETLLRWELWEEALVLGGSLYLAPTGLGEEQARRARLLGLAHLALGQEEAGQRQVAALEASARQLREERRARVDAAEAKAREEKKNREETEKAMADALKAFSEPLENVERQVAELKAFADLRAGRTNELAARLGELKTVAKERLAGWWFQLGDTNKALTLAREAVDGGTNQVHPQLVQVELLWKAGRTNDALEAFGRLRGQAAWLDLSLPIGQRIEPVARAAGHAGDWRPAPAYPADSGVRPELARLGSFRWDPQPAPALELRLADGRPVRLA